MDPQICKFVSQPTNDVIISSGFQVVGKWQGSISEGLDLSKFKNQGPKAFEWVSKGAEEGYILLFW